MIRILSRYRVAIAVALGLTLIELFVELIQPFIIHKIIDDGIQAQDLDTVWKWGGILILCAAVAFTSGIINSFYSSHVSQSFGFDIREKLYVKVQSLSQEAYHRFVPSSLITRLTNDVTQLQNTVFMALRIMLRAPLMLIGGLVMSFVVKPSLAVFLLLSVPLLTLFLIWILKKGRQLFTRVQDRLDRVNGVMQENLIGVRLVRAFVRRKHEEARFDAASGQLMDETRHVLRLMEATVPFILFVMNMGIIAVLWFGSSKLNMGSATVGEVVAVVNYAMRMTMALSIMSWIIAAYARARASAERINEVLETENDAASERMAAEAFFPAGAAVSEQAADQEEGGSEGDVAGRSIQFEAVTYRYPGAQEDALTDVSFTAPAGSRIAIMGATGSGKSTMLQLIPRLIEPASGVIRIDGADIRDIPVQQLRGQIGYVPQQTRLFSGTIRDNIAWGKEEATPEEIEEAARNAQIHDLIARMQEGYDTMIGQRGVNLSGGQRQRMTIARALVRRPSILLLDDSTSALDARTEANLLQALKSYSSTVLIITQKISTTLTADCVLLLEGGRLIASGTHEELLDQSPLYRRIYHSQYGKEADRHAQSAR